MNLVQINERLKDLPMQVLQQYANGMNPEVPPYLALGELQRREIAQKQMATAQGGMQGPQPSVKEQVEQKAGLMAAQALQQQQAMQQMQQPRGPMPVPAGVPQPEMQPQAMMARGGLAGIPVRRDMFEYAGGGIIAFQSGGDVDAARQEAKDALARLRTYGLRQRQQDPEGYKAAEEAAAAAQEKRQAIEAAYAQEMSSSGVNRPATSRRDVGAVREAMQQAPAAPMVTSQGPEMPVVSRRPPEAAGLPAALSRPPVVPPAAGPRPAPTGAPAGLPAAATAKASVVPGAQVGAPQNVSPFIAETAASAREKPVAPTPEGIIAEQAKLLPPAMQEAAVQKMIAEQRARAEARQAAYEKSKPSGLDDLIRVYGQAAQYKGGTGLAPAYTSLQQQRRAEDLAMQKQQDELLTAIEGREYGAAEKLFGAREKSLTAAQTAYQNRLTSNTKALADLAGVDQRRLDEIAQNLNRMEVAKLQAATANRPSEAERIEAKYMSMKAKGQVKEAEEYLNNITRIKGGAAAGIGAEKQELAELKTLLKNAEETASNFALPKATRDEATRRMSEINNQIASMTKLGAGSTSPAPTGKVPPLPPGFKLN